MIQTKKAGLTDPQDCAIAWFAVLERARATDDYPLASRAVRELERLGVSVRFARNRRAGGRSDE